MRKLLVRASTLVIGLIIVIVMMRQIGSRGTDHLAQILDGGNRTSAQACWYAICPGSTDKQKTIDVLTELAEAQTAQIAYHPEVAENGYVVRYDACATFTLPHWIACIKPDIVIDQHDYMVDIQLRDSNIKLGDVIARLGNPTSVWMCTGLIPSDSYTGARGVNVYLLYENGIAVSAFKQSKYRLPRYPTPPEEWRIRTDMQVYAIEYYAVHAYYRGSRLYFAWRGFGKGSDIRYGCGN